MAIGKRNKSRQSEIWVVSSDVRKPPSHPFYKKLNELLDKENFDSRVEEMARPFYKDSRRGRPSLPPGTYVRLLFIGYFEGIDSERGIAWRVADSLALGRFLGYELTDETPDHSTISKTRRRLPTEFHEDVFSMVMEILAKEGLIKGKTLGIDASTMDANAALRSIVRKDTGEKYQEFLERLAKESGIETPTKDDLARFDKKRKGKKTSNNDWKNPYDPDAKVTKMKDGRTHLAYKPENAVDLDTGAIVAAEIHTADKGDTKTVLKTLAEATDELANLEEKVENFEAKPEEVVTDKGSHSGPMLVALEELGMRTYISEPKRGKRKWTAKNGKKSKEKEAEQKATYANRRRIKGKRGKRLRKKRAELVERTFAHLFETGGMRRTFLRERENVAKRYTVHAAAFNLGILMRKVVGRGKPRWLAALLSFLDYGLEALTGFLQPGENNENEFLHADICPA